jgi:hypothetical protein
MQAANDSQNQQWLRIREAQIDFVFALLRVRTHGAHRREVIFEDRHLGLAAAQPALEHVGRAHLAATTRCGRGDGAGLGFDMDVFGARNDDGATVGWC